MVKIHFRIYRLHCAECDMQMELVNLMDDTKWRCLGCNKIVEVDVRTIRKHREMTSLERQTRSA